MDPLPECSVFMVRILDELDTKHSSMSYQDLCQSLCARFDVVQLAKLRSLLFHTACLDPSFPATLFKDKLRCSTEDPLSKKLLVAADIVTMFNLIQMNGGSAKDKLPAARLCKKQRGSEDEARGSGHLDHCPQQSVPPCSSYQHFVPTSDPNFLLGVQELKCGAHLPQSSSSSPSCHLQSTYCPTDMDRQSTAEQESLRPFSVRTQRRNAFHSCATSPQDHRRALHRPSTFFTHSFELPYTNPYFEPALQDGRRAKHESLDDLQASTYFGPTTISESVSSKVGRKQPAWAGKSLSLNTEDTPPDCERKESLHRHVAAISTNSEQHFQSPKEKGGASPLAKKANRMRHRDGPSAVDKRCKRSVCQGGDSSSVATQTEHRKLKHGDRERHAFRHCDDDSSEIVSDDISDIFRFLDDTSVCDSLGVVQSSRYDSNGSLSQVTLKSECDSVSERNTVRLAKSKLDCLFSSLENSDDELKVSVCKLLMRIGEIEKKLESLSGVRSEISQVLCKLNKLDEKIQEPEATPDKLPSQPQPRPDAALSPLVFQCLPTSGEWCCSDVSHSDSLRVKALKKSMFTRGPSRSLNEDGGTVETAITSSPRDWRTVSYSCHPGDETDMEEVKEAEQEYQYEFPKAHRLTKPPKETFLREHPYTPSIKAHVKSSPLYTELRLTSLSDGKRRQPSWIMEEYKNKSGEKAKQLTALDLQTQESLNPNNLEYWMEDVYTPGFDSLLKKKEAELRRAKVCKIGALIAAATCTLILVIVVPICTMKT